MPAKKKDVSARARRNQSPTKATLQRPALRSVADFTDLTVVQLRARITEVNQSRPADQQIQKRGSKAELVERLAAAESPVPPLPKHPPRVTEEGEKISVEWDAQTVAWWNDVWTSPMASEWDPSDVHNVLVVALLYDDIWSASTPKGRKDALAEYRLQRADLGLSPYSRRRLEWTIETAAEAVDRGTRRRSGGNQGSGGTPAQQAAAAGRREGGKRPDPRAVLTAVK